MKRRWMMLGLVGAMAFAVSACGREEAPAPGTAQESEAAGNTDEQSETIQTDEEFTKVSERADYIGIEALEIGEYVTLPDYGSMTVQAERPEITDALIESYINDRHMLATQRAVETGDTVDIDYVGKKDGVAFQGGTASGARLEIGSGSFIDGFEDGLIGVMPGETVDLQLTFPDNYRNASLAGAPVVFTVTVNGIALAEQYADVTEEQLAQLGVESTREELWAAGRADAEEAVDGAFRTNVRNAIVQELVRGSTVTSAPDYLIEEEMQSYNLYMEAMCRTYYNVDLETYLTAYVGITGEEYDRQLTQMCTATVEQYLIMEAVLRAEGLTVTQEEIAAGAAEEAALYGYDSGDELIDEVGYTVYRMSLVQELVLERLEELVTVEEAAAEALE
ncbi:MAG: FKBP-type peptidyl-prolyl cis-trans isomerase [Roseburia sp.]|nr:FKBP-type peptidyl-prolyl cis-trans isomerase [Roseburia sp.]